MCSVVGKQQQMETRDIDDTETGDCCKDGNGFILFQGCIFAMSFPLVFYWYFYLFRQTMITKIFFLSFKTEKENNCAAEVYTFVEKNFLSETDELKHDVTKNSQGIY